MTFDEYQEDPQSVLSDPSMLLAINDQIYTYHDSLAIIMAQAVFGQQLPEDKLPKSLNSYIDHADE